RHVGGELRVGGHHGQRRHHPRVLLAVPDLEGDHDWGIGHDRTSHGTPNLISLLDPDPGADTWSRRRAYGGPRQLGGLILPERRWIEDRDRWRRAEQLGFDHAWTYDHIAWRELRDEPWFAAVPTLSAAALVTSTIRLGTLVASPNFRHPVPF